EVALQLLLLGAEEADLTREDPRVAPVRQDNLDLTLLVATLLADDPELEEKQLDVVRELLAARRVRDLDRVALEQRRRSVAREERLQEPPLERLRPRPDPLGNALLSGAQPNELRQFRRP